MTQENKEPNMNTKCAEQNKSKQRIFRRHDPKEYRVKQNKLVYYFIRFLAIVVSFFTFKRKLLRNEIKNKKGPFVIIANHAAALDFVNLIGATRRPLTFVISNSFYNTLPCKPIVSRLGMIPKQQFQTSLKDIHKMKTAIDDGRILVIYPAGLMSDAGTPTPTPVATYSFLKWLKTDVYVAKTTGTYFSMPKWRHGGIRPGRTYMDIYKLFDKDELLELPVEEVHEITDKALFFDAYEDQEKLLIKYKNNHNIEGLENILYVCPHCKEEFTMKVKDESIIYCEKCGFEEKADEYGFLHKNSEFGEEIRHPSKWYGLIHDNVREKIESGELSELECNVEVQKIPDGKSKFEKIGDAKMKLTFNNFTLTGRICGEDTEIVTPIASFASLPYKPGKYLEIQHGDIIYRCLPDDGRLATKFINMVKVFYEIHTEKCERAHDCEHHDACV